MFCWPEFGSPMQNSALYFLAILLFILIVQYSWKHNQPVQDDVEEMWCFVCVTYMKQVIKYFGKDVTKIFC
jgi:hypothetical protein